ncbi:MAG TPA: class I SAM-dependent methyltransferase [Thermoanaerobaculia bacterium]
MSDDVFGAGYASLYDATYRTKDYTTETRLIEETFKRFGSGAIERVLDLGCGTGNYALQLAAGGYRITAVDRSADMLRLARAKAQESGPAIEWLQADLRDLDTGGTYDAALLMFAVIGYFPTNDDLIRVLGRIRAHLAGGGLLLFDFWYGPAVIAQRPESRVTEVMTEQGPARRTVTPELDERHQTCDVVYGIESPDRPAFTERHRMRFFFPMELELLLQVTGFEMLSLSAFPTLDRPADQSAWNAYCVARAGSSRHSSSGAS